VPLSTSRLLLAAFIVACELAWTLGGGAGAARAEKAGGPERPRGLGCEACLVVDDTGRLLWARRPGRQLPNASTTKMVTALLAVRRLRLDARVTVSPAAARVGEGGLDLRAGQRYTVRDLLYALLLSSSNDAAVALAERVAGSEAAFVAGMNRLAARLGARRTHFVSAHGLDAPRHYSTARDLARIAAQLLANPRLADVVDTPSATISAPGGAMLIENRNVLLETYRGAIGVKTGFTDRAGEVLVAAASRRGRRLVAVAMGSDDATVDCRRMLDYGFARLRRSVLLQRGAVVGRFVFDPSGSAAATAAGALRGMQHPATVELAFEPAADVRPPIERGEPVGRATLLASGRVVGSVPAVAAEPLRGASVHGLVETLGAVLRVAHHVAGAMGLA
jgi:D-alanyl-D-alanine carboxypeptidase (penicillin-binding protein 5/6)